MDPREVLFNLYYSKTVRSVAAFTGDFHLAEDAVQEAFVQSFRNLHQLRNQEKFGPWLFVIAKNQAKSIVKKRGKALPVEDTDLYRIANREAAPSAESEALARRVNEEVHQALLGLSDEQREAIILFYFYNASIRDISELLGIKEGTVKSRLFRARHTLAGLLLGPTQAKRYN